MRVPLTNLLTVALLLLVQSYLSAYNISYGPFYFQRDTTAKEIKVTSVIISVNDQGRLAGTLGSKLGFYESLNLRQQFAKEGLKTDAYLQSLKKKYPENIELSGLEIDSSDRKSVQIQVRYNIDGDVFRQEVVNFNAMLAEGYTVNPFETQQPARELLIERDEIYAFSMDIPAGYEVGSLPDSVKINLNNDDGFFEYKVGRSITRVNLRSRIKINRGNLEPETLRTFFGQIVKKHSEQIVFRKKK